MTPHPQRTGHCAYNSRSIEQPRSSGYPPEMQHRLQILLLYFALLWVVPLAGCALPVLSSAASSASGATGTSTGGAGTSGSTSTTGNDASSISKSGSGVTSCSAAFVSAAGSRDVRDYGACCNSSVTTGTGVDDTIAFQSAAIAATALFRSTGVPVELHVPNGCKITGSITYGSGVHWRGPGSIVVPSQHAAPILVAVDADDVSVDDLTVTVLGHDAECASAVNTSRCVALSYETTAAANGAVYRKVRFVGNTIYDASWAILVNNQAGNSSVNDIHVDRNTVISTAPYTYHDGIHIAGGASLFTISNNNVFGRGDAAIAVTSEVNGAYLCSGGTISGNTLLENLVGIDDSGCSNLAISGNIARATTPVSNTSNPAFRSIFYGGVVPTGLTISGNTFINAGGQGNDYGAKFDLIGSTSNRSNSTFSNNTVSSLYTRGSNITIQGNSFLDGARYNCDVDSSANIPTDSIMFGQNSWLGVGTASCEGNANLITNDYFAPQMSVAKKLALHISNLIVMP